jgi:MOSC domain-containing protein YiiM
VGELTHGDGLAGDNWRLRSSHREPDHDTQLTMMNARVADLVVGARERWPLAGDQLYVDFDLSVANAPPGTRLAVGDAVVELTEPPHTGCKKFVERFGMDAMLFVNAPEGRELRLRGANARVVRPGTIRVGDAVTKLDG